MKRKERKRALLAGLLAGVLLCLAGCGSHVDWTGITPPDNILPSHDVREESKKDMECVLYFDNTQSMSGFVRAENSDFIRATDSVCELMSTWKGGRSFWYIDRDGTTYLNWQLFPTGGLKFKEAYKHPNPQDKNCFYTYYKGAFAKGMGPLQLLFPEQAPAGGPIVDFSKLNIFITDMAEQNKENMDLAKNLQEIVKGYDNHSVTLFAVRSNFTGQASVANSGSVGADSGSNMVSSSFHQTKLPFYIIIIGPTEDALKFSHDLREYFLEPKKMDYHYAAFLSNGGLQEVKPEQITVARTVGAAGIELEALLKGELTVNNSNETVQLTQKYRSDLYAAAADRREQTALYFDLAQQRKDLTQALTTIYIPLPARLDPQGNGQGVIQTIYKDLTASGAGIACGITDAQNKTREQISLLHSSAARTVPAAATSSSGGTSVPPAQAQFLWVVTESEKLKQYIGVSTEVLQSGTVVRRITGDSAAPLAKQTAYEVKSENGVLQVQLRLRSIEALRQLSNKGYISVHLPITAVMNISQDVPLWVKEWTYYAAESTDPNDKFLKTEGLDSFFHVMHNSFGDAQSLPEHRKVILELAIDIRIGA